MDEERDKKSSPLPLVTPTPRVVIESGKDRDDETTKIRSMEKFWEKTEQMDRRTRRLLNFAEVTQKEVQGTKLELAEVSTRLNEDGKRISSIEDAIRSGHGCIRSDDFNRINEQVTSSLDSLNKDILEGAKTRGIAQEAAKDVKDLEADFKETAKERRNSWRAFWGAMLTILIFTLGTGGAIVWYFGQLDERVADQAKDMEEANQRLENGLKAVKVQVQTSSRPVVREVQELQRTVKASNGNETTEEWCAGLNDDTIHRIKLTTPRSTWPSCRRFGKQ